jgi:hypothetical protein
MTWPMPQNSLAPKLFHSTLILSCGCSIWVWRLFVCALCSQNLKLRIACALNAGGGTGPKVFEQPFSNNKKPISREGHCSKALDSLAHTHAAAVSSQALAAATEAGESKSSGERERDLSLSLSCCEPTPSGSSGGVHVRDCAVDLMKEKNLAHLNICSQITSFCFRSSIFLPSHC